MADANFSVYNDAGVEQVSFGGVNLALIKKQTVAMNQWTATSGPLQTGLNFNFTITAKNPMVALCSDKFGGTGAVFATIKSIGSGQFRIDLWGGATATGVGSVPGVSTLNANVIAYVFDAAPAPTAGQIGLMLFDAAGNCTFNSNYPGARIIGQLNVNQSTGVYDSITPPAGKTYAAIQRSTWGRQVIGSFNTTTGDKLANTYFNGMSGGLSGAKMSFDPTASGGAECFLAGFTRSFNGGAGGIGNEYVRFGSFYIPPPPTATQYYADGVILDVTGF